MPYAAAQRAASGGQAAAPARAATPHLHSSAANFALGRNRHGSAFRRSSPNLYPYPYTSLPFPFLGDAFDPSDIYSTGYPVASQPPPSLLEALSEMTGAAANSMGPTMSLPNQRQPTSSDALLIELQNGRYVRVDKTAAQDDSRLLNLTPRPAPSNSAQPPLLAAASPESLPPAILIFQDGHSEEVRDYTIADGMLYARGDYYADGYWNKKIVLAALNLPQTLAANARRKVKFVLPASPNEVITRP
jgi:hypothetical protein